MPALGVVVPAGGRGRRLDGEKLTADVTGVALLDRTLDGLPDDAVVVCVGPALATRRAVAWTRETPAWGGPLAAVAAGVDALPPEVTVVVLVGGDMPDAGRAVGRSSTRWSPSQAPPVTAERRLLGARRDRPGWTP